VDRDLLGALRGVGKHRHAFRKDLHEAATDKEQLLRAAKSFLDAKGPWLQRSHQRRVARQHAQLSIGPAGDDELDVAFKEAPLDAHHPKGKLHEELPFFFIASPCSRASSI